MEWLFCQMRFSLQVAEKSSEVNKTRCDSTAFCVHLTAFPISM